MTVEELIKLLEEFRNQNPKYMNIYLAIAPDGDFEFFYLPNKHEVIRYFYDANVLIQYLLDNTNKEESKDNDSNPL